MYKVMFECDVNGLASVKRYESYILVEAETAKSAKDKASEYIKTTYSETFAILYIEPMYIVK